MKREQVIAQLRKDAEAGKPMDVAILRYVEELEERIKELTMPIHLAKRELCGDGLSDDAAIRVLITRCEGQKKHIKTLEDKLAALKP